MDDGYLEKYSTHKKGDILSLNEFPPDESNEWTVKTYLIGGYELINLSDATTLLVETKEVDFAKAPLDRIKGHVGHEVVVSFVWHPDHDSFLYCKSCKKEIENEYKKL
ncbi:hypothetical protein N9948_01845 [bacterium]|nr:hypothetical protein [bacterium]